MLYLQQFNIIIRYKKGTTNKLADTLSRPPSYSAVLVAMQIQPVVLSGYAKKYDNDQDFKERFNLGRHVSMR
ncbi:hypothetical protein EV2_023513 [Malus domestica]